MKLLISAFIVYLVAMFSAPLLTVRTSPEVKFWIEVLKKREALVDDSPDIRRIFVTGGSSCAFSIEPTAFTLGENFRVYNVGVMAGAGPKFLIAQALKRAVKGDVLVLALERHFLTSEAGSRGGLNQLAVALSRAMADPSLAYGAPVFAPDRSILTEANELRPGARFLFTYVGKIAAGREPYRYSMESYLPSGRLHLDHGNFSYKPEGKLPTAGLSEEGRDLLLQTKKFCETEGIEVYFSLPWLLTEPGVAAQNRELNLALCTEINEIIEVLPDEHLGIRTDPTLFADSTYHLMTPAAVARSQGISRELKRSMEQR